MKFHYPFREAVNRFATVSTTYPSAWARCHGIKLLFSLFTIRLLAAKSCLTVRAWQLTFSLCAPPVPSSRYIKIQMFCLCQCATRGRMTFVKTKGAVFRPKGRHANWKKIDGCWEIMRNLNMGDAVQLSRCGNSQLSGQLRKGRRLAQKVNVKPARPPCKIFGRREKYLENAGPR